MISTIRGCKPTDVAIQPWIKRTIAKFKSNMPNHLSTLRQKRICPTATNQPGPDTLRIRVALTGVSASTKALKVYEYIPVALVAAGIATAIGERDLDAFVITEGELLKSDTGERLFMSVRKSKALERLKDTEDPLTADHVRQVIDDAAEEAGLWLESRITK